MSKVTLIVLSESAYGLDFRSVCEDSRDVKFCSHDNLNAVKHLKIDNIIYIGDITFDLREQFEQLISD